jgi:hypothetical protein
MAGDVSLYASQPRNVTFNTQHSSHDQAASWQLMNVEQTFASTTSCLVPIWMEPLKSQGPT